MKALFAISNLRGGGAQKAMSKFAAALTARGHEVHLMLLEEAVEYPLPEQVPVHFVSPRGKPMSSGWLGKRLLARKVRRKFRKLSRGGSFDLLISTLPFTDEVVRLAGLPGVWFRIANTLSAEIASLAGDSERKATRRRKRYQRLYDGQRLIAVSKGVAADIKGKLGVTAAEIRTIYNPFDFDEIRRAAALDEPDLPAESFVVHAGSFLPAKRHDLLLDAFRLAELPHRLVLLVRPSAQLSAMIEERGLSSRVIVAGFRRNPYPWIKKADALLLTSDREGMPNVLIEALICGTPVVSTNCPSGPGELLTGNLSRWLVACGDTNAFAARLKEVVTSPPAIDDEVLSAFSEATAIQAVEALARPRGA